MMIKPQHKHVDSNGQCYLPYLSQWRPEQCHFAGLFDTLCAIFSGEPPVYSKEPPQSTPINTPENPPPTSRKIFSTF